MVSRNVRITLSSGDGLDPTIDWSSLFYLEYILNYVIKGVANILPKSLREMQKRWPPKKIAEEEKWHHRRKYVIKGWPTYYQSL